MSKAPGVSEVLGLLPPGLEPGAVPLLAKLGDCLPGAPGWQRNQPRRLRGTAGPQVKGLSTKRNLATAIFIVVEFVLLSYYKVCIICFLN